MTMWQGITAEMFSTWDGSFFELANACARARANAEQATFPVSYLPVILHCLSDSSLSTSNRTEMIIPALQMNCSWTDLAEVLPFWEKSMPTSLEGSVHTSRHPQTFGVWMKP